MNDQDYENVFKLKKSLVNNILFLQKNKIISNEQKETIIENIVKNFDEYCDIDGYLDFDEHVKSKIESAMRNNAEGVEYDKDTDYRGSYCNVTVNITIKNIWKIEDIYRKFNIEVFNDYGCLDCIWKMEITDMVLVKSTNDLIVSAEGSRQ